MRSLEECSFEIQGLRALDDRLLYASLGTTGVAHQVVSDVRPAQFLGHRGTTMSRDHKGAPPIHPKHVETYLRGRGFYDARLLELQPLGLEVQEGSQGVRLWSSSESALRE